MRPRWLTRARVRFRAGIPSACSALQHLAELLGELDRTTIEAAVVAREDDGLDSQHPGQPQAPPVGELAARLGSHGWHDPAGPPGIISRTAGSAPGDGVAHADGWTLDPPLAGQMWAEAAHAIQEIETLVRAHDPTAPASNGMSSMKGIARSKPGVGHQALGELDDRPIRWR
jgi:hypothetical protein